jgi:uncharacterized protein (DUF1330 family)
MTTMVIRHTVGEYDGWRNVYDEVGPLRDQFGVTGDRVLKEAGGDGTTLLVIQEFADPEQAQAFADSAELKAAMQRAGVTGPPRIEFYDEVG